MMDLVHLTPKRKKNNWGKSKWLHISWYTLYVGFKTTVSSLVTVTRRWQSCNFHTLHADFKCTQMFHFLNLKRSSVNWKKFRSWITDCFHTVAHIHSWGLHSHNLLVAEQLHWTRDFTQGRQRCSFSYPDLLLTLWVLNQWPSSHSLAPLISLVSVLFFLVVK